jgi:hypothetical protein
MYKNQLMKTKYFNKLNGRNISRPRKTRADKTGVGDKPN